MFFTVSLYVSLVIFLCGLLYKASGWFRYSFDSQTNVFTPARRFSTALGGILKVIFSAKILTLIKVLILEVLLQTRILKESLLRWIMHMCIYGGFMLLLLMHALDNFITIPLFSDYASTLNPFMFLRNLFFLLVIIGLCIALYRRLILKPPRLVTNAMDHYCIIILAVIMVSGVLLEGVKITSYTRYKGMVEDYADTDDEEELQTLESYWVAKYGIVSPNLKRPFDDDILFQGREIHEMSCAACHSRPQWAFLSYGAAKAFTPIALGLDKINFSAILLYIHFLACFIGLAYLPFSKMFHIITSPLSLLANAVMYRDKSDPANIATRQIVELDACTHCGTCTLQCSVGVCFEGIKNVNILPSEKLASIKAIAAGKKISDQEFTSILDGLIICTNCYHCTVACPVGINLQDLWFSVREALLQKGYPALSALSPLSYYRGLRRDTLDSDSFKGPLEKTRQVLVDHTSSMTIQKDPIRLDEVDKTSQEKLALSNYGDSFSYCFTCMTCSSSCPVVQNFDKPNDALGLVPHQIIRSAVLGLPELAYSTRMLWGCLGCYQCQENCPQGVKVTDIFYELKNMAIKHMKGISLQP